MYTISGEERTQVCMSSVCVCVWGGCTSRWLCAKWLCAPGSCLSICVCDWYVAMSECVSSFACFHVVMCEWYLGCFLYILFGCMRWSAACVLCICVRACACLQEECGRRGALAAQASPSVSLPPLAPSALAEVVTRRQTANGKLLRPERHETL